MDGAPNSAKVVEGLAIGEKRVLFINHFGMAYVLAQPISLHPIMVPRQKENSTYMMHIVKKMDITKYQIKKEVKLTSQKRISYPMGIVACQGLIIT